MAADSLVAVGLSVTITASDPDAGMTVESFESEGLEVASWITSEGGLVSPTGLSVEASPGIRGAPAIDAGDSVAAPAGDSVTSGAGRT